MTERRHVVLLGDSIFDNQAYTAGAPDVVSHLRRVLPEDWRVNSVARDGATIAALEGQLSKVPSGASHLVISIGGNDALQNMDLLTLKVRSSAEALEAFAARVAVFERAYRRVISEAAALRCAAAVCTIYNGALEEHAAAARVGLAIFNDVILRAAIDFHLDALELRSICTEAADYANRIEPSGPGGLKIARAIALLVGGVPSSTRPARVWGHADAAAGHDSR
jgi:lysophospholipase L1-like esterase